MSNKDYYARWLKLKEDFLIALAEDERIQELAIGEVGLKPQATAVEIVARVYAKYCQLFNSFCDCFDQMEQVQRRPYIKTIIDALTCRILELKNTLEEVEVFEFTYPDNALQQMLIKPDDIEILCPFFYSFEIREAEKQYIIDQIFAGNRIGDPPLTQEEIERQEEELRLKKEEEEKEAELRKNLALEMYEDSEEDVVQLTPAEIEANRLREEYETHLFNIQRMERSRCVTREKAHQKNNDENMYLELAGLKKPKAREDLRYKASEMIRLCLRMYMKLKRDHLQERKLREKLGMIITSAKKVSAKEQLEKVKEARRNFRQAYYEKWLAQSIKEKSRILRLKEGDVMDDISDEIRQWFTEWFGRVCVFDEFPYAEEGGSILIVTGETFSIDEYIEWKDLEEKRLKAEGATKTKEQIKAEKKQALEEKRRIARELKEKEKKRLIEYKKSRLNPDNDPGVYIQVSKNLENLQFAWASYQGQWKAIDEPNAPLDAIRGHLKQLIIENAYKEMQIELRPIVDEAMRLELEILKKAMKASYQRLEGKIPITRKRKKPKKPRVPKPEKISPETMFQLLADNEIVRKYPRVTLDDYWGDRNYAAADCRGILWTPSFPPHCIGDVKEQVRIRCLLTLGASCPNVPRSQLIVGPKNSGKKTLIYAVATETNALLIDLSPLHIYDKLQGPKQSKIMWQYINKISRLMQPTIIFVDHADKMFYKKVPKEEKMFDPTRLSKDFFKQIIKPIGLNDKILVLGTASEPWLAKGPKMFKVFPETIMIPTTDYGSLSFILKRILMAYHGVDREFNVHSLAQALRGYDICTIKNVIARLLAGKRAAELTFKPLDPVEVLQAIIEDKEAILTGPTETEMFQTWYANYSPWGQKCVDYMLMIDTQYQYKLKQDKKKKGK